MTLNDRPTMTVPQAMAILRAKNITKVDVSFSGGNDEGGADGFTATDANGEAVELPSGRCHQDWQTKEWVVTTWGDTGASTRPATPEEIEASRIEDVLERPIYDQYGGFAGDFEVSGTLTWDVSAGTYEMHGEYGETVYESF